MKTMLLQKLRDKKEKLNIARLKKAEFLYRISDINIKKEVFNNIILIDGSILDIVEELEKECEFLSIVLKLLDENKDIIEKYKNKI
jgi:hypothetical protein